ncbi:protein-L-isoaspartate(D-aspartate) O-methyltransferase [Anderseniella sp. Alg231-50]|uniref:protein-L-isoaspartate(D-aspartate) O-methyltransferase n=1 Tax=Anderseniella sp. Alg231-50 TaxID=1922226 RepID=UPI000D54C685
MTATDQQKIELIMGLRSRGIRDTRVLEAIETVPREVFVPDTFQDLAYADQALPIECGQTLSQPFIVAFMTEKLKVGERMKVLEIGTGSGYQTVILAQLCRRIYTIERYRTLLKSAERRFAELRQANITTLLGDGNKGWPKQAPFERIIVTAAAPQLPRQLIEQLAVGGILVVPVEVSPGRQEILRITRTEEDFTRESLMPVRFVPLVEGIARGM